MPWYAWAILGAIGGITMGAVAAYLILWAIVRDFYW